MTGLAPVWDKLTLSQRGARHRAWTGGRVPRPDPADEQVEDAAEGNLDLTSSRLLAHYYAGVQRQRFLVSFLR